MKILLWIGDEPNQKALANKINEIFPVCGIITERKVCKPNNTIKKIGEKIIEKIFLRSIGKSWWGMQKYYDRLYPEFPRVEQLVVENINTDEAYQFTKQLNPDLIFYKNFIYNQS